MPQRSPDAGCGHGREHLAQLTALTQRLAWPGMGNASRSFESDA